MPVDDGPARWQVTIIEPSSEVAYVRRSSRDTMFAAIGEALHWLTRDRNGVNLNKITSLLCVPVHR